MSDSNVLAINERAAEEFFKRGQEAEAQGLHGRAVDFYERALNENPDDDQVCFQLALLYDRQADDAKAIELYERICTTHPVHLNALVNLAVLYEDNNHYEEAYQCLQTVLRTNPNHQRARLYMKDVESALSVYYEEEGAERLERRGMMYEVPLSDFELSVRSRNCLKKMNLRTLGDLLRTSEADLMGYKNFGETSLNEIKALLASKGLRLGQASDSAAVTIPSAAPAPEDDPSVGEIAPEIMTKSVMDLELSVRSRKALQRLNIGTLAELTSRTEDELLGCKNFGQTSLNEIKQQLGNYGLGLRKLEE